MNLASYRCAEPNISSSMASMRFAQVSRMLSSDMMDGSEAGWSGVRISFEGRGERGKGVVVVVVTD